MQRLSKPISRRSADAEGLWSAPGRSVLTIALMVVGIVLMVVGRSDRNRDRGAAGRAAPVLVLDLNEAPIGALSALPGVGRNLARRIIADRQERPFGSPAELQERTPGVGPGTLARLAPHLRVETDAKTDRLASLE